MCDISCFLAEKQLKKRGFVKIYGDRGNNRDDPWLYKYSDPYVSYSDDQFRYINKAKILA